MLRLALPLVVLAALAGCQAATEAAVTRADATQSEALSAPEGACWATDRIPAQTETRFVAVEGQTGLQPQDEVIRPAEDRLFAVPCPELMTADLIASLQRALSARGLYAGPVTGALDTTTADAIRRYQAPLGLESGLLSLDAAQQLGLVAIPRDRL